MIKRLAETVLVMIVGMIVRVMIPENYDDDTLS